MTGAEAMAKCLMEEKVEILFGYPGVAICPFFDALGKTDIRSVLVRTEQNAGHAASGYARTTGRVGVCAVTSGPGATNLLTGIATAFADSVPLVCISGQVETDLLGSDVFQEADITGAAESFVKYSYIVKDVNDIPRVFKEAFHIANTGRKGPVLIDMPIDIQLAKIRNFEYPEEVSLRTYKPTVKGHIQQIRKAMQELTKAERPLILAGGGIFLSRAKKELKEFSEKHQIPVVSTMMGIGVLPTSHELYFGMIGNNGCLAANRAMKECDVLMMVGARVADRAVASPDVIMENKTLIHIDVDPAEIGKNVGPAIPIVGDAKAIFRDLEEIPIETDTKAWLQSLNEYRKVPSGRKAPKEHVDPAVFIQKLSLAMEEDGIYVADVGQNQIWSCRNVNVRKGRFFTTGGMGTMGYSIPAAIGAKLADMKKQVVAVCGDGAFQMSMMELAVIMQEKIPLKIVVMKNNYLGLVREFQHFHLDDAYEMVELGDYPRLDRIAEAYDIEYFLADSMDGIDELIRRFLDAKGPALLEARPDPMDTVKLAR
ncbi:MAG: biosynthetic-type acetolactate synthase large subunit [Lachnospiraceae bacterium]|nr:biosynthetic-type acetolactate synthase large subunit [Lachnospiraceae bacterium]